MKKSYWRYTLGALLIVLGILFLLQTLGTITFADDVLGIGIGAVFCFGGLTFLSVLIQNKEENWWAAIPGIILFFLGLIIIIPILFPRAADGFIGGLFLAGISLSFWVVYLITPKNWWAIIPGGVMLTIAAMTIFENLESLMSGGLFFLGLGATFALVALLPGEDNKMTWPWIPAGILAGMGILLALSAENLLIYVVPTALIVIGIFLVVKPLFKK